MRHTLTILLCCAFFVSCNENKAPWSDTKSWNELGKQKTPKLTKSEKNFYQAQKTGICHLHNEPLIKFNISAFIDEIDDVMFIQFYGNKSQIKTCPHAIFGFVSAGYLRDPTEGPKGPTYYYCKSCQKIFGENEEILDKLVEQDVEADPIIHGNFANEHQK